MSTLRMTVRLTNAVDEALARRGIIPLGQVRSWVGDALIDAGSVSTVISFAVINKLGLMPVRLETAKHADGRQNSVPVTEPITISLLGRQTCEEAFALGDEICIGQTVIRKTDLVVDLEKQRLIPNPKHSGQWLTKMK